MHKIIIDNKTIEISDESYENLREQLLNKLPKLHKLPTSYETLEEIDGYYIDNN